MKTGYNPIKAEIYFENYGYDNPEEIECKREEKEDHLGNIACDAMRDKLIELEEQRAEAYAWGY